MAHTNDFSACSGEVQPVWLQCVPPPPVCHLPESLRCRYMSKHCDKPRTMKKSGELHRFCAFHRERANHNQRRVDQRRRLQKKAPKVDEERHSDVKATRHQHPRSAHDEGEDFVPVINFEYDASCRFEATLDEQDITILNALLFDDDTSLRAPHRVELPAPYTCQHPRLSTLSSSKPVSLCLSCRERCAVV